MSSLYQGLKRVNKYMRNPEITIDLKELQEVQLEIVQEFDKVCRANNLKYHIYSGTLIGAVRHKGFIPWDDDIDISMLRDDYERFLKVAPKYLSDNYFIQNYKTDKEFVHSFTRLQKKGTTLVQSAWQHIDMSHKIFIDIFPMDYIEPNTLKGKLQFKSLFAFRKFKDNRRTNYDENKNNIKNNLNKIIQKFTKLLPMSFYNTVETKIAKAFYRQKTATVTLLTDGNKNIYYDCLTPAKFFVDVRDFEFEGVRLLGPVEYDSVLKRQYGDYMTLPKKEDQVPHHNIIKLNFNNE